MCFRISDFGRYWLLYFYDRGFEDGEFPGSGATRLFALSAVECDVVAVPSAADVLVGLLFRV